MFFQIIKADFLQRIRSHNFLIIMFVCFVLSCQIIPMSQGGEEYRLISLDGHKGIYNAAWVGACISSVISTFTLIFGFYIINSTIDRDIRTGVGQIIATSFISNRKYLFIKVISNYLVLSTLLLGTMLAALVSLFWRGQDSTLDLWNLWTPFLVFPLATAFLVACAGVVFEIIFARLHSVGNAVYLYFAMFALKGQQDGWIDISGEQMALSNIKAFLLEKYQIVVIKAGIGFTFTSRSGITFEWTGFSFSFDEILLRYLLIVGIPLIFVILSSVLFRRFDISPPFQFKFFKRKKKAESIEELPIKPTFSVKQLPEISYNFSIFPLILAESKIMLKGKSIWWLILTGIVWLITIFADFEPASAIALPILMVIQVARLSDLGLKEVLYETELYVFSSFQPFYRLLFSRLLATYLWLLLLALPTLIRCIFEGQAQTSLYILSGILFLMLFAFALGMWVNNRKFFEIVFLMATYLITNKVPFSDYLGIMPEGQALGMPFYILIGNVILFFMLIAGRKRLMAH